MHFKPEKLLLVAVGSLGVALVQAADLVKPNIKPGLWEVRMVPQVSGEMPIPEAELAKLSPEQRARFEAAMKAALAKGATPHVYKDCMTPEKISRGFDVDKPREDASCQRKVISSSANELTVHDECNGRDSKTVSDMHFEVKGGTQASGKIKVVSTSGSKTMNFNSTIDGKWLASSCGNIKDSEKVE